MNGYISVCIHWFASNVTGSELSYHPFYFLSGCWTLVGATELVSVVLFVYSARQSSDFYNYFLTTVYIKIRSRQGYTPPPNLENFILIYQIAKLLVRRKIRAFDKVQFIMARRLGQSISEIRLVEASTSAEEVQINYLHGFGQPM